MFNKKRCERCNRRINSDYDFCPYCGASFRGISENFGMLGRDDSIPFQDDFRLPMGFNTIFNSLMKSLDKQFKSMEGANHKDLNPKKEGISISISSSGNEPPKVKVKSFGRGVGPKKRELKKESKVSFSPKKLDNFSKLPRIEPGANVRRFSDKVVYEINLPGVSSIDNVSLARLEKSIELKAVSKKNSYFKSLPVDLPVIDYFFSKGKLVLEFATKN